MPEPLKQSFSVVAQLSVQQAEALYCFHMRNAFTCLNKRKKKTGRKKARRVYINSVKRKTNVCVVDCLWSWSYGIQHEAKFRNRIQTMSTFLTRYSNITFFWNNRILVWMFLLLHDPILMDGSGWGDIYTSWYTTVPTDDISLQIQWAMKTQKSKQKNSKATRKRHWWLNVTNIYRVTSCST